MITQSNKPVFVIYKIFAKELTSVINTKINKTGFTYSHFLL